MLAAMADMKGGGGNYQSSIVDLLKLLDLDSSLVARKELAAELNVHAGEDGSAEQNIALHRAVICAFRGSWAVISRDLGHAFHGIAGSHFAPSGRLANGCY
ncbi:hypothetical protein SBA_ch1_31530 [Sphingomonas bisphenolicum]|uniref:DUF3597 domain-containing protein n=1 Tax=Sphingomonas bisphenolicum TaxID=296544 RepID=A0ABN5WGH7_9SPHN|nr:hypothetical protein SBA_ch1_31530 [Sphingomonas bisphenolicum]